MTTIVQCGYLAVHEIRAEDIHLEYRDDDPDIAPRWYVVHDPSETESVVAYAPDPGDWIPSLIADGTFSKHLAGGRAKHVVELLRALLPVAPTMKFTAHPPPTGWYGWHDPLDNEIDDNA